MLCIYRVLRCARVPPVMFWGCFTHSWFPLSEKCAQSWFRDLYNNSEGKVRRHLVWGHVRVWGHRPPRMNVVFSTLTDPVCTCRLLHWYETSVPVNGSPPLCGPWRLVNTHYYTTSTELYTCTVSSTKQLYRTLHPTKQLYWTLLTTGQLHWTIHNTKQLHSTVHTVTLNSTHSCTEHNSYQTVALDTTHYQTHYTLSNSCLSTTHYWTVVYTLPNSCTQQYTLPNSYTQQYTQLHWTKQLSNSCTKHYTLVTTTHEYCTLPKSCTEHYTLPKNVIVTQNKIYVYHCFNY